MSSSHASQPDRRVGLQQAGAFLNARFGARVEAVQLIGQGEWSRAYAFRHANADCVIRFGAFHEDFAKDRLAGAFSSPALPVPRVLEIGEALGGFYAIAERVFGTMLDGLTETQLRQVLPSLFAALDAARLTDLSGSTGYGLWHADGIGQSPGWRAFLLDAADDSPAKRTHGWRARLAASPTGDRLYTEALAAMTALAPLCPEIRHLIHADLLHDNVFVSLLPEARVSGIIDWGCSLYGDFLYDLAWLSFWSPLFPAWRGIDFPQEARRHYAAIGLNVPDFNARLRCYELHIGLDGQAYSAFMGRWDEVEATAQRTLVLARAPLTA
ncbi:MAG: phosphotransferase family protein [Dehalococcoidia bacterium]